MFRDNGGDKIRELLDMKAQTMNPYAECDRLLEQINVLKRKRDDLWSSPAYRPGDSDEVGRQIRELSERFNMCSYRVSQQQGRGQANSAAPSPIKEPDRPGVEYRPSSFKPMPQGGTGFATQNRY